MKYSDIKQIIMLEKEGYDGYIIQVETNDNTIFLFDKSVLKSCINIYNSTDVLPFYLDFFEETRKITFLEFQCIFDKYFIEVEHLSRDTANVIKKEKQLQALRNLLIEGEGS
ncbi:HTH LytTR-type domain-containing protein [Fusobacterium necrophorum subsp. funduliforme]|uniref:hypothetical protein n=1 Tax=Fusobacterium necrophorum TaxID=859 RepID=UPI00370E26D3